MSSELVRSPTRARYVARRLRRDVVGLFGVVLVAAIVAVSLLAPILAPHDPVQINLLQRFKPPGTPGYFLGTDMFGRDVLSRLIWGGRVSLYVGILATLIAMGLGVTVGLVVGYLGGRLDQVVMRLVDVMLAFPYILLAIVIVAILGPSLFNALMAVAITSVPFYIRFTRGMLLSIREQPFVEAAEAVGATRLHVLWYAILPNVIPYMIVAFSINLGWLILEAASLSFLGLGVQPPTPEWGAILSEARQYVTIAPHTVVSPGLAILASVVGFNLMGDSLRDALDVKLG